MSGLASPGGALTQTEIEIKLYCLLGMWVESLLYGAYLYLFIAGMSLLGRKQALTTFSSRVFFAGSIAMFIPISIHNSLNLYRLINAFGYAPNIRSPALYMITFRWENYSLSILLALTLWIADSLVIYRCFVIWQKNWWIIAIPSLLSLLCVVIHTLNIWGALTFARITDAPRGYTPVVSMLFPLYLAQNVLTTSLVVIKIWLRHRETRHTGLVSLHTPSLVFVMRIIVESAAIYTTEILVAYVLLEVRHPARLFFLYLLNPSIGIAFILLVVRAHAAGEEAKNGFESPSMLPTWLVSEAKGEVPSTAT